MLTQTPQRASDRRMARAVDSAVTELLRETALAARTPDDWPDDFGPYPNRRTRRVRRPRHSPTGIVTERQNRSDTAKQARARRVKQARKGLAA